MASKAFKNFIDKAEVIFKAMHHSEYPDLLDQINDLYNSLSDIKRYTASVENDGNIGANIVICELIIELLSIGVDMKAEFIMNLKLETKVNNLRKIRDSAIKIEEKLEGANNSYDDNVRDGVKLILLNVKNIKDMYNEFVKKETSDSLARTYKSMLNTKDEIKEIKEKLRKMLATFEKVEVKTGGSKRTKRKSRKTRKTKKMFFGLF